MYAFVRVVAILTATVSFIFPVAARDQIWIVGSGTAQPFTTAVAERVAKAAGGPAPIVEHTGTALAFTYLCAGTGAGYPNAASVTRRMTKSELDTCQKNGVTEIVEIPIGLDILVVAQSKAAPPMRLTLGQMYLALARDIPDGDGGVVANPHTKWSEIDRSLPDARIDLRVLPETSGTREALQVLFLQKGAQSIPELARLMAQDNSLRNKVRTMRRDPPFVMVHEDPNVIARQLVRNPNAVGVFGYRFLQANAVTLRGVAIEGVAPTEENVYAGRYSGSRRLYIYVRKGEIDAVPGLDRLAPEFLSSAALGPNGYLLALGFVPLPMEELVQSMALAKGMPPLRRERLPD
jgi:phosphate transport system substrate-binding protein